jgi:aspartate/methionine/tyrosine aminotransferase
MDENPLHRELRRKGGVSGVTNLIDTNFHTCGFRFPDEPLQRAAARYFAERRYAPDPQGSRQAREAIARHYRGEGLDPEPEQLLLTASTSEAYQLLFNRLAGHGANVLLPRPGYPLFEHLAQFNGLECRFYDMRFDRDFAIYHESLEASVDRNTAFICLISPNNPTGAVYSWDSLRRVLRLAEDVGASIISDEVFSIFRYDEHAPRSLPRPAALEHATTVFTVNGVSKMFASPDLKLGWILATGPQQRRDRELERLIVANDMFLNASPLSQALVPTLFAEGAAFQAEMVGRVEAQRRVLLEEVGAVGQLSCVAPRGGIHLVLCVDQDRYDDEELAIALLREEDVYVHPGYLYGLASGTFIVTSYLAPEARIREGMRRIGRFLT